MLPKIQSDLKRANTLCCLPQLTLVMLNCIFNLTAKGRIHCLFIFNLLLISFFLGLHVVNISKLVNFGAC